MQNRFGFDEVGATAFESGASWSSEDQARLLTRLMKSAVGIRRARVLSRLLLDRFGSLADVLAAGPDRLNEVAGVGPATISLLATILEAAQKLARERVGDDRPFLSSSSQVREYLHVMMAHLPVEQLRILFLNKKNRLIADEVQQSGTIDHTPVYPREVIRRSLELSASAIILAHNHPSGDPSPSTTDIRMTREIAVAAKPLGIIVHDHVIVGRSGVLSMRTLGMF